MLLIKSLNLNSKFFLTFFLAFSFCFSATGEEAVDIWNKKKIKQKRKFYVKIIFPKKQELTFLK
jgi:hypothetical protein